MKCRPCFTCYVLQSAPFVSISVYLTGGLSNPFFSETHGNYYRMKIINNNKQLGLLAFEAVKYLLGQRNQ